MAEQRGRTLYGCIMHSAGLDYRRAATRRPACRFVV